MTRNLSKRLSQSRDMAPSTGAGAGPGSLTELQSPTMDADLGPSTAADAEFDVSTIPDANVTSMFFTHFVALFVKRARYARYVLDSRCPTRAVGAWENAPCGAKRCDVPRCPCLH